MTVALEGDGKYAMVFITEGVLNFRGCCFDIPFWPLYFLRRALSSTVREAGSSDWNQFALKDLTEAGLHTNGAAPLAGWSR